MDFDSMTVPQLKDIARANNLKNWSKLKKADLIQFLIDNVPGGAEEGDPSGRPRTPSPRPRSRSPSPGRSPRRRSPARLKKRQCEKNLRKDVVAAAEDYGIAITKAGGKKKTIKELCAELEVAIAQQPPCPLRSPLQGRTPLRLEAP